MVIIDVAKHHHRHGAPHHRLSTILLASTATFLFGYFLLEKKLLPRAWWRTISRLYFFPLMVPNMLLRVASGRPYFSDVDGGVMLGAVPMVIAGQIEALHRDGVRGVINMQAEYAGPIGAYAVLHPPIEQLHIPVTDHTEPSVMNLETAVKFIQAHRSRGERVLVHCKGGHGRSAAVAMAWLITNEGLSPDAAQRRLSSVRHVRTTLYRQPEILEYYARHKQG